MILGALTTTVTPLAAAIPAKVLVFTVPALLGIENVDADGMLGTVTLGVAVVVGVDTTGVGLVVTLGAFVVVAARDAPPKGRLEVGIDPVIAV